MDNEHLTFSQRNNLSELPRQLSLGEISEDYKRNILRYLDELLDTYNHFLKMQDKDQLNIRSVQVTKDVWCAGMKREMIFYEPSRRFLRGQFDDYVRKSKFNRVFDLIEHVVSDGRVEGIIVKGLISSFETAISACRIIDGQIVAIGQEEQGRAYLMAVNETNSGGYGLARAHLLAAGGAIATEHWADSVRESITAVESVARNVSKTKVKSLGDALKALDKDGVINPVLKAGFEKLYGYTNGEEGVRHALLEKDEANVDETDALFMLGACASFVSYLIARSNQFGEKQE